MATTALPFSIVRNDARYRDHVARRFFPSASIQEKWSTLSLGRAMGFFQGADELYAANARKLWGEQRAALAA